jgi:RNA polymerase sigma-70 factor (sigma-E family)
MDFDDFARRELPRLLRYAVMLTGDRELAQDLVQDVMIKAHGQWRRVSAADHPDRYVHTMLTRLFLDWKRRWSVRSIRLTDGAGPEGAPVGDHAGGIAERDDVWRRLAGLPRQQRVVLVLRYYERLTDAEIAAVLGCGPSTVRGYASRALSALRLDLSTEHALERDFR